MNLQLDLFAPVPEPEPEAAPAAAVSPRAASAPLPAHRKDDWDTSVAAAEDATPGAGPGRSKVLVCLLEGPATDYDLAAKTGMQQNSIGKRRGDCCRMGLVEPYEIDGVPAKRPAPSGSLCRMWVLTELGRDEALRIVRGDGHGA